MRKSIWNGSATVRCLLLAGCFCTASGTGNATDAANTETSKFHSELLGKTVVDFKFPSGWKTVGRNDIAFGAATIVRLEKGREGVVVMGKYFGRAAKREPIRMLIVDVINSSGRAAHSAFQTAVIFPRKGMGP